MESAKTDATLGSWVESLTGGKVTRFELLPGGSSRETWLVDVVLEGGDSLEAVLRHDNGEGPLSGTELSLGREAIVYRALQGSAVPVPEIYGSTDDAILLERMPGAADFTTLTDPDEREAVSHHFIEVLAALHSIDPDSLDLPGFARPSTPEEHALCDLAIWERIFDTRVTEPEPLVRFGLTWLKRNPPSFVERTALVQGDTGPGNFLFEAGQVTAVLDWEFVHLGDPMDDLAWVGIRDYFQPFGDLGVAYARWSERSGLQVDAGRILYYRAFLLIRCAIATLVALENLRRGNGGAGVATYRTALQTFRKLFCQTVSDIRGETLEPTKLPVEPTPDAGDIATALLNDLTEIVVPAVTEPLAARRAQELVALALYLRSYGAIGTQLIHDELEDLTPVLGHRPSSLRSGRAELTALVADAPPERDGELLRLLNRFAARNLAPWSTALGPFATKPFAPVPVP